MEGLGDDAASPMAPLTKWKTEFSRAFQIYLDKSTPLPVHRWLGTLGVAAIYVLRVYYLQGFYIISYGLGIYILNLLIGFISPKVDPELEALDGASLPTKDSDEFRPFIRRLPEFKFCSQVGFLFENLIIAQALTVITPILVRLSASANLLDYNGEMKNGGIQSSKELNLLSRRSLGSIQKERTASSPSESPSPSPSSSPKLHRQSTFKLEEMRDLTKGSWHTSPNDGIFMAYDCCFKMNQQPLLNNNES